MIEIRQKGTGAVLHRVPGDTLRGANLSGADLRQADLRNADLRNADLSFAYVPRADLSGADLRGAILEGTDLGGTSLARANLSGLDLGRTLYGGTDLRDANVCGTNFLVARRKNPVRSTMRSMIWFMPLHPARLAGARYNAATRWPMIFDPEEAGCIRIPDSPSEVVPAASPGGTGEEPIPADRAPEHLKT
jgi:hypothetical protein